MLGRRLSKTSPVPILAQKPRSLGSLWGYLCRSHLQSAANTTTSQKTPPRAARPTGRRSPTKRHAILPSDDLAIHFECTLHNGFALFISWWGGVPPLFDSGIPFYQGKHNLRKSFDVKPADHRKTFRDRWDTGLSSVPLQLRPSACRCFRTSKPRGSA